MLGADKFLLLDPSNTVYQAYNTSVSTVSESLLALITFEQLEFMHAANPALSVAILKQASALRGCCLRTCMPLYLEKKILD